MERTQALYGNNETSPLLLWLDHWQYTGQLLLKDEPIPWFHATDFDGFFRKADALLDADVVVLPVGGLFDAHVESAPEIRTEMGAKKRTAYGARVLLGDETLRSRVRQCIELIGQAAPHKPLVLSTPSPKGLVAWAFTHAHGSPPPEVTVDSADSGAMYLSDFLSSLSECAVAAIMAEDDSDEEVELAQHLPVYSPLRNVCSHLRWQVGLRLTSLPAMAEGFDFVVAMDATGASGERPVGRWLPNEFWADETDFERPSTGFVYGQVPVDATPERVLQQRKRLRAA